MLIRRILTALALITGFAATGSPANAAVADTISEQVLEVGASQGAKQGVCVGTLERGLDPMKQSVRSDCKQTRQPIVVFIPTVQLGTDRALE